MKPDTQMRHEGEIIRSAVGYDITPLTDVERADLAETLTDEERSIILHQGTERPF